MKQEKADSAAGYNLDFKDQLTKKVLSRIEKRYNSRGSLDDAELDAFRICDQIEE